ncbi:MAG: hypothetical protein AAFV38_06165, partial [Pseudomonadota bacterium]
MLRIAALACAGLLCATTTWAATITTNSLNSPETFDFSSIPSQFSAGPIDFSIGDVTATYTADSSNSVVGFTSGYGLNSNGNWTSARNGYVGTNSGTLGVRFDFDTLLSGVGGLVNYAPGSGSDAILEIFGSGGQLLESFNLVSDAPISTSVDDDGAFRGFSRN